MTWRPGPGKNLVESGWAEPLEQVGGSARRSRTESPDGGAFEMKISPRLPAGHTISSSGQEIPRSVGPTVGPLCAKTVATCGTNGDTEHGFLRWIRRPDLLSERQRELLLPARAARPRLVGLVLGSAQHDLAGFSCRSNHSVGLRPVVNRPRSEAVTTLRPEWAWRRLEKG